MICFIIAMEKEAAPVLKHVENARAFEEYDKRIVTGKLFERQVAVVISGVGKVNAAAATQYAICKFDPEIIVNFGVAGGLNSSLEISGIYSISRTVQYDFDLTQLNGTAIGTLDEFSENYLPLWVDKRYPAKSLATGDRFNDSPADFELLTKTLGADIRDMECAAIVQTCVHAKRKCAAYKIISDLAGSGSTTEQYLKNLSLCFERLEREFKNIVDGVYNG